MPSQIKSDSKVFKYKFIRFADATILPICYILLGLDIFKNYINMIPHFYIMPIRIILFLGAIAIIISNLIKSHTKNRSCFEKEKCIKDFLYLNVEIIINNILAWYIPLYILLRLDKFSIYFSFLMLLILGIFYGYKIAKLK